LVGGLAAGLVIFVMSVTGVLLMYQKQITRWADGIAVQPPSASAERLPVETLLGKVTEKETAKPTAITLSIDPRAPATFAFGREKTLFVDPYTGAILGEGSKKVRAFFQSMIDWHRWLARSGDSRPIGKAITGASNLVFLFLVISGFYLWWPRNWNWRALRAVTVFDGSLTGKARDWNWHNVIGFWSALPLAVVVFTAVFFSYPWATDWLYRATGETPPPRPGGAAPASREARAAGGEGRSRESAKPEVKLTALNQAWARAEAQMSGWRTISLRVPANSEAPLAFTIDAGNGARPDLRGQLTLDPATGEVKQWETYESYGTARKIRLWVRWLHTGEAGGVLGQTIAGGASAAGVFLVWTGVSLALRRFWKRGKPMATAVPQEETAELECRT